MNKKISENFSKIYKNGMWGMKNSEFMNSRKNKKFYSGGGSNISNDKNNMYINLVQSYVDKEDVKKVIEVGCGDWEMSSYIDWSSVEYNGYDVVPELIEYNSKNFSKDNINFFFKNIFENLNALRRLDC